MIEVKIQLETIVPSAKIDEWMASNYPNTEYWTEFKQGKKYLVLIIDGKD